MLTSQRSPYPRGLFHGLNIHLPLVSLIILRSAVKRLQRPQMPGHLENLIRKVSHNEYLEGCNER